jgi:hypothetical protein
VVRMMLLVHDNGDMSGADLDIKNPPFSASGGRRLKTLVGGGYLVALAEAEAPLIRGSYLRNSGRMPRSA